MTSNGASNGADGASDDLLYHVTCEIIDYHEDKSGATRTTDIYGTLTSLLAAKAAARSCLKTAGYVPSDFTTYKEKSDPEDWEYTEDVTVYAKAPAGQEFRVRLDLTPNVHGLKSNKEGLVEGHLHYVLQTKIDYSTDRAGGSQSTEIEGVYLGRQEADHAAYNILLDDTEGLTRESFAEYDRRDEQKDDWPYGEDVLVHAVSRNGENFKVEVKMQPKTHHKRGAAHNYQAGAWK